MYNYFLIFRFKTGKLLIYSILPNNISINWMASKELIILYPDQYANQFIFLRVSFAQVVSQCGFQLAID